MRGCREKCENGREKKYNGRSESCECLTASGNSNWAQAAEVWSSLPHRQTLLSDHFEIRGQGLAAAAVRVLRMPDCKWQLKLGTGC